MPDIIEPPVIPGAKPSTPAAAAASAQKAVEASKTAAPTPLNDAFAELDTMAADAPAPPPKEPAPKPVKAPAPPKPETPPAPPPEPKPPAKPPEEPAPPPATPEKAVEKMAPKELRDAYNAQKQELKRLRDEHESLKKAVPADDPEKKALVEEIERNRKRLSELESEMTFVDYTKSKEFEETYKRPYEEAWARAIDDLDQLQITDGESGESRKATMQDMIALSNMSLGEAWKRATEWFGPAAQSIMHHRDVIRDLHQKQTEALTRKRTEGEDRRKQREAAAAEHQTKLTAAWNAENERIKGKYPKWFAEDPADPEGNQILAKGYEMADRMFKGNDMKPEEAVFLHAAVRNRAAAFGKVVHLNKKLSARIKELETELAEFRASEPGPGDGNSRTGGEGTGTLSWEAEIDAMAAGKQ